MWIAYFFVNKVYFSESQMIPTHEWTLLIYLKVYSTWIEGVQINKIFYVEIRHFPKSHNKSQSLFLINFSFQFEKNI